MDYETLAEFIKSTETHRRLLGDFRGAYSLGITQLANGALALVLQMEEELPRRFPPSVWIGNEEVALLVEHGHAAPSAVNW